VTAASALSHLEGSHSGRRYPADRLIGLDPADARPLLARYDLERAARTLTRAALAERRAGGLWRWAELLPVADPARRLYLGEGSTPLLDAPRLGAALGAPRLRIKAEGLNPTARSRRAAWRSRSAGRSSWARALWWRRPPATPRARWPPTPPPAGSRPRS
jgi:threonine synthase